MKFHPIITILACAALAFCNLCSLHGQALSTRPVILGSAVDPAADIIRVDDVSVSASAGQARQMKVGELANVPGLFESPIVGHEESIVHYMDQLMDLQTAEYPGDGKYLVIGGGGDSMGGGSGFNPFITQEVIRRFGQGAVVSTSFSGANTVGSGQATMSVVLAGSASSVSPNFTYLPNGEYWSLPIGGSVTETPNSGNITAGYRRIRCWYGIRAGGGTLTFTVTQNGAALTAKSVNTSVGTAGTIGYVDFVAADGLSANGKPSLAVTNASGISHYLGSYMYLNTGFVPVSLGRGDTDYVSQLTGNAANLATFCEAMDVRLILHATKENGVESDLEAMMDRWAAQHPRCTHIWVGATSSTSQGVWDAESNAAMRAKALALKMCFVDGQRLLRSVAYMNSIGPAARGWNEPDDDGDVIDEFGPHLSLPARRFIATFIIDKLLLGLNVAGGRHSPATLESLRLAMLSDTRQAATIWAQTSSLIGSTNFTQSINPDHGRMSFQMTPSPAPVANTGRAGKFMSVGPLLNSRSIYRYRLSDGQLTEGVMAVVLVGGVSQSEAMGLASNGWNGFRIIHGVQMFAGALVPYIQFAIKGSGTSETLSPVIYHSATDAPSPHNAGTWAAGTDNMYWVEYLGNGTGSTKRFRAWHQSCVALGDQTRIPPRRLIADWSGTITVGGQSDPSTYFGLITNSSPLAPASGRSIALSGFVVDQAPRFTTDIGQQDFNF
jgi:hypothetical protein